MEIKDFNWDEIKEELRKAVKLEKFKDDLSVKITILAENIEETQMIGDVLKEEEEMKRSFGQFLGMDTPLECDIEMNQDDKYIIMKMKTKKDFKKVHKLLNDMFFGDFFKKMIDAMMGAFKGVFEGLGDAFDGMAEDFKPEP